MMLSEKQIINYLPQGVALCVAQKDAVSFQDINIVFYNRAFAIYFDVEEVSKDVLTHEDFTHLSIEGKKIFETMAHKVLNTNQLHQYLHYSETLGSHFQIVFSPIDNQTFLVTVNDVSLQVLNATEKEIILSSLHNLIMVFDQQYRYRSIFVSEDSELFLPKEHLIGHSLTDLYPSDFCDPFIESLNIAKQTNDVVTITLASPIPLDDRIFTYQQQFVKINNQNLFISTAINVTEDIFIRQQLEKQTQQLEKFFTVNLDLLTIIDFEGYFVRVNRIWKEILGYDLSEIEGKSIFDFIHPDDIDATQKVMNQLNNNQEVSYFVNRYKTKNGDYRTFEWRASFGDDVIYAAARDITDQQEIESKLRFQKEQFEMAIEGSQEGIWDWDISSNTLFLSKRWKKMLGYKDDELENRFETFADLIFEDDSEFVMKKLTDFFDGRSEEYDVEFRMKHKDGSVVWIRSRADAIRDNENNVIRMAGSHSDITKSKHAAQEIQETYFRLNQMAEFGRLVVWELDKEGRYIYASDTFKSLLNYEVKDVIGKYVYDFHPEQGREYFKRTFMSFIENDKKIVNFENKKISKEGNIIWVSSNGIPIYNSKGELVCYRGSDQDISNIKQSQADLAASEEKYRLLTENLSDVLWIYHLSNDQFTYYSSSIENLTGYSVAEMLDKGIQEIMNEESYQQLYNLIQQSLEPFKNNPSLQRPMLCDVQIKKSNGLTHWVELSFTYRFNDNFEVEVIGVARDIEDRKKVERQLQYLSFHDTLTGLYNRAFYEEELKRLNTQRNLPLSIIMADINDLKLTNDTFGHIEGDKLIKTFASVLRKVMRQDDIIARIGGDEFVMLLPNTDEVDAQHVVDRIYEHVQDEAPTKLKLSVALGHMTTHEPFDYIDELFRKAEDAMYKHKLRNKLRQEAETVAIVEESFKEKYPLYYQMGIDMIPYVLEMVSNQNLTKKQLKDVENATRFAFVGMLSEDDISLHKNSHRIAEHGYHILKNVPAYRDVADIVLALFENVNGSGLPHRLEKEEIPYPSKVIRIVMDYCHYKNHKVGEDEIKNRMLDYANLKYDEGLLNQFFNIIQESDNEKIRP